MLLQLKRCFQAWVVHGCPQSQPENRAAPSPPLVMSLQADRGTVHFELRFVPFKAAGDQITGTDNAGEPQMSRTLTKGAAKPEHKGVLTVTLVKGSALAVSRQLYGAENVHTAVAQLQGALRWYRGGLGKSPTDSDSGQAECPQGETPTWQVCVTCTATDRAVVGHLLLVAQLAQAYWLIATEGTSLNILRSEPYFNQAWSSHLWLQQAADAPVPLAAQPAD